jgi:hypothetical protein
MLAAIDRLSLLYQTIACNTKQKAIEINPDKRMGLFGWYRWS